MEKILEGKNFKSDSAKADILERAKARENKWYVAAVQKIDSAKSFTGFESAEQSLTAKGIDAIQDVKYVCFNLIAAEIISVKTATDEYVIPYGIRPYVKGLENGNVYTVKQINEAIKTVVQEIK